MIQLKSKWYDLSWNDITKVTAIQSKFVWYDVTWINVIIVKMIRSKMDRLVGGATSDHNTSSMTIS